MVIVGAGFPRPGQAHRPEACATKTPPLPNRPNPRPRRPRHSFLGSWNMVQEDRRAGKRSASRLSHHSISRRRTSHPPSGSQALAPPTQAETPAPPGRDACALRGRRPGRLWKTGQILGAKERFIRESALGINLVCAVTNSLTKIFHLGIKVKVVPKSTRRRSWKSRKP